MSDQSLTTYRVRPRAGRAARLRHNMIQQVLEEVRISLERAPRPQLEQAVSRWKQAAPKPSAKIAHGRSEQARLVAAVSGGRVYTLEEALKLEVEAQERAFARRHRLLQGSLTAPQVARLLGTTRQTPHDRAQSQTLLAIEDKGSLRFPHWQFDANGPNGVLAGLPDILKALDASPLGKIRWFTLPNPYLEGRTPLEALKAGDTARVVNQAQAVGAGV